MTDEKIDWLITLGFALDILLPWIVIAQVA